MTKNLLLLGANNPEVVRLFECFKEKNPEWELRGFLDDDPKKKGKEFMGYKIFGGYESIKEDRFKDCYVVNVIAGDCRTRKRATDRLTGCGARFTNLIHPNVYLRYVKYGTGLYIQESVILQAAVTVQDHVSIHMGSLIGHESFIGESSFIAHGCAISGRVTISPGVFIGVGATILPHLTVGEWSIIGAGAVVTKDVPPYTVVVGNPARFLRNVSGEEK